MPRISEIIRQDADRLARLDEPHYRLLAGLIIISVQDAHQTTNLKRRAEALEFLWTCCPTIAESLGCARPA